MYNPQLETFIVVADNGSFSKAAEVMFISPPAVIKQINLLESRLGVRLFERTHRGLQLTQSGKSLYEDAKYVINYCKESVERAKAADEKESSVIRIGTSPMTPSQFLIDLWEKIHDEVPDIKFELVPYDNTPENARDILMNMGKKIDIVAGAYDERALELWQCSATFLTEIPQKCAVSMYNPLAKKEKLTMEDMKGQKLMLICEGFLNQTDALRHWLTENYPEIEIVTIDFLNTAVFNECEKSNNLFACIDVWSSVHPLLKTLPVEWDFPLTFGLLHSPKPSKTVQRFLKAVKKIYQL